MPDSAVTDIQIATEATGTMHSRAEVQVGAEQGILGDRYGAREGSFSKSNSQKVRDITLIEQEAIEAVNSDYELPLTFADTRRNVLTRGVALNHLVGKTFRVGEVELRGTELCEPCTHIEKLSGKKGIMKALVHRGGLRARVLSGGTIRRGDPIEW